MSKSGTNQLSVIYSTNPVDQELETLDNLKVRRDVFKVASLHDESDEKAYWHARTADERLAAIEVMRQIVYGYDPSSERLQRFFEVAKRA